MLKIIPLIILTLLFTSCSNDKLKLNNTNIVTIKVKSMGNNRNEAISNASEIAIKQVVGELIVSNQTLANDELIKDEILTYSNAIVKSFKITDEKIKDNQVYINVAIEIQKGKVFNLLNNLHIDMKNISNDEFKAITKNKYNSLNDFSKMVDTIIIDPIKSLKAYKAEVITFKPVNSKFLNKINRYNGDFPVNYGILDRETYEKKLVLPYLIMFKVTFKSDYIEQIMNLFENVGNKKSLFSVDTDKAKFIFSNKYYDTREYNNLKNKDYETYLYPQEYKNILKKKIFDTNYKFGPRSYTLTLKDLYLKDLRTYSYTGNRGFSYKPNSIISGVASSKLFLISKNKIIETPYNTRPTPQINESGLVDYASWFIASIVFLDEKTIDKLKTVELKIN